MRGLRPPCESHDNLGVECALAPDKDNARGFAVDGGDMLDTAPWRATNGAKQAVAQPAALPGRRVSLPFAYARS